VLAVPTDVSKLEDVVRLRERVYEAWGEVSVVRRGLPSPPPYLPSLFLSPFLPTFCDSSEEKEKGSLPSPPPLPCRGAFPVPTPLNLIFRLPCYSIMLGL
jgi:hypothetical protein